MTTRAAAPEVTIPPIWCPIEPRVHPQQSQIETAVIEWLNNFEFAPEIRRRGVATRSGSWASRVAPDGDLGRTVIQACWACWAFLFDDQYIDDGSIARVPAECNPLMCRVLHSAVHPETADGEPFSTALTDLVTRYRSATTSPTLFQHWLSCHYVWLLGSACSVSDRSAGRVRSVDDHMIIGPLDRASALTTTMIEISEGTELPTAERDLPHVRALTGAAHILETCYNDIGSYHREVQQDAPESDLVYLLQTAHHRTPRDAMADAAAMLDRVMTLFLTLRDQCWPTASQQLRRYLTQLSNKIRGNLDFQRETPRYSTGPGPAFDYTDHPTDGRLIPVSPSIAWWWDLVARH
ncbi:hypothetical protein [Nocardia sp. N2S4-5]|uniref:terpene synthase family protein n=1 Tax=Nocardia sp. N2S4-5 TaxID=3351565 RepID=UPI0037CF7876